MEVLVDDLNTIFQKIDSLLTLNEYFESEFLRITLKTNLLEVVNFHMRILRYDSIYITNIYSEWNGNFFSVYKTMDLPYERGTSLINSRTEIIFNEIVETL